MKGNPPKAVMASFVIFTVVLMSVCTVSVVGILTMASQGGI